MTIRSCVTPQKQFIYGIHKPAYTTANLRVKSCIKTLGHLESDSPLSNRVNFPDNDVQVESADWIFEIPNPLAFRGTTFIDKEWADASAANPDRITLPTPKNISLCDVLRQEQVPDTLFDKLPSSLHLTLATTSNDPRDLIRLADLCCSIEKNEDGVPTGLRYAQETNGRPRAVIHNHALFEAVANNPALPDSYKVVMVLRPGAQGGSEIIGEFNDGKNTHVFEYLRRNSYIAGGHYAANMADDAIRYSIEQLSETDMTGLRHLYYQRTFIRLAEYLDIQTTDSRKPHTAEALEQLRERILHRISEGVEPEFSATLWGWNFGFDYAPTHYRLHASHQQIHQQYAMLPQRVDTFCGDPNVPLGTMPSFGCGDMVAEVLQDYHDGTKSDFFSDYIDCIRNNVRMDDRDDLESSLILWEDAHAVLFVPKAQTSQWELQLLALRNNKEEIIGNILEADTASRTSLNRGLFLAQKALAGLGAKMVTSIEFPKRIGNSAAKSQHLLYSFLPKLPESPGAFSEAQLRYINGHYPEDFAAACRKQIQKLE